MLNLKELIKPGAKVNDVLQKIVEESTSEDREDNLMKFADFYEFLIIEEKEKDLVIKEVLKSFDTS